MNHFGDLLHHEFIGAMNGYDYAAKKLSRSQHDNDRVTWIAPENVELPAAVDWRDKGKEHNCVSDGRAFFSDFIAIISSPTN